MTDVEEYDYELLLNWQDRYINDNFKNYENVGIDTETLNGYANLICDSFGNHILTPKEMNFDNILKYLTYAHYRGKKCFFYNERFDFDVMMKHLGDEDKDALKTLYSEKALLYKGYEISFIPKKHVRIIYQDNYYNFYDLAQFYKMKLKEAALKYTKHQKLNDVSANLLNTNVNGIWEKQFPDILKYCKRDALITKELADYFFSVVRDHLKINVKSPYSEASMAQQYMLHKIVSDDGKKSLIPTINDFIDMRQPTHKRLFYRDVLRFAIKTYYAGRFEILRRGYFENAYEYDISSAYPYQLTKLIDVSPDKGKWEKVNELHSGAHYGYYLTRVYNLAANISPFKAIYKKTKSNLYPSYEKGGILYLTKTEIDFILKNSDVLGDATVEILDGYEFYPSVYEYPYKDEMIHLYEWKESERDESVKKVVKTIMNSIYGKTWQAIDFSSGKLWNPFYATEICAGNRVKLLEFAIQSPNDVISLATDSVTTTKPFDCPIRANLGEFELKFNGELLLISSGFYDHWNKLELDANGNPKSKIKRRGLGKAKSGLVTLPKFLNKMRNTTKMLLEEDNWRPVTMTEAIDMKDISKAGMWINDRKEMDVNSEIKREWDMEFKNGKEVMSKNILSEPRRVMEKDSRGIIDKFEV